MWKFIAFMAATVLYGLTCGLTLYKIPLALRRPYQVYPWEDAGPISNSHPVVLTLHIVTAVWLVTMTWLRILAEAYLPQLRQPIKSRLHQISRFAHNAFMLFVLINCWNLGDLDALHAVAINVGMCFLLAHLYRHPRIYFIILSIPTLLELATLTAQFKDRLAESIVVSLSQMFH